MQNEKIVCIVVVYGQTCKQSQTLKTLKAQTCQRFDVWVWDNTASLQPENLDFLRNNFASFKYMHCPENKPLSDVYTKAISACALEKRDRLVLLDQDSTLPENYVEKLLEIIGDGSSSAVLVPRIYVRGRMFSPGLNWKWFGSRIKNSKQERSKYISAINSGLCLPINVLSKENFCYPKGLKNYGTDVFLFEFIRERNIEIAIVDSVIEHDLTFDKLNKCGEKFYSSYIQHMDAMKTIFCKGPISCSFFYIYRFLHCIKQSIIRKQLKYITWCLCGKV